MQSFRRDNRLMLINRLPQSEAPEFMKAVELAIRRCGKVVSYKDSDEEEPESSFEVGASDD